MIHENADMVIQLRVDSIYSCGGDAGGNVQQGQVKVSRRIVSCAGRDVVARQEDVGRPVRVIVGG